MTPSTLLKIIKHEINSSIKIIVVSKLQRIEKILDVYNSGHISFGENKVQELISKIDKLPSDIEWHFIGHLQTNKVKYIAPIVSLIHSVDSQKLLKVINIESRKNNRIINCLLQFHIAEEETKHGFTIDEAEKLLESEEFKTMQNIRIIGVMGMATFTDDRTKIRGEFKLLKSIFDSLSQKYFTNNKNFKEISMGMTNDYNIAIEESSTMLRIGSKIFNS